MHILGYIVTLASLTGNSPQDVAIRITNLQTIADELQYIPDFTIEGFRQTGYQRIGRIGIYLSKNVQNYLFNNEGNPEDEGLWLTLFFSENSQESDDTDSGRQTIFVPRDKYISAETQKIINNYAQTGQWAGQGLKVLPAINKLE